MEEEYYMGFEIDNHQFQLGSKHQKQPITSSLYVISTHNNLLFYFGKGINSFKFHLPKKGDENHELFVKEVIWNLRDANTLIKKGKNDHYSHK